MLKGMGLTDEQVGAIIEEHVSVVDGLKGERDKYKEDAGKLPKLQEELESLKTGGEDWRGKYDAEHKAFEDFKKEVADKETLRNVKGAYRALLEKNNVGKSHIDAILRVTDFKDMKLNKEGALVDEEKLTESIEKEWAGFITSKEEKGAQVATPPKTGGSPMTKEQIMKIKDATERQKAIAENIELFGH